MTEADLILAWARGFALTVAVEVMVAVPMLARNGTSSWRRCATVVIGQFATHPFIWFVVPVLHLPRWLFLGIAELWAFLIEAVLYQVALPPLDWRRAALVSAVANGASLVVGLAVRATTGWV